MNFINRKGLVFSSSLYILGDSLSKGVTFLLLPVYTRFLSPREFGLLSLATSIATFMSLLLSFRGVINRFYYQYEKITARKSFLGSFWLFLIIFSLVIIFLVFLFRPIISNLLPSVPFYPYLGIVLVFVFLKVSFFYIVLDYYQANFQPKAYFLLSSFHMIAANGSIFYFVVSQKMGAFGYLLGELISLVITSIISGVIIFREFHVKWNMNILKPVLGFSLPLFLHYFFHLIFSMSYRFILDRFGTINQVGIYSFGYQIALFLQLALTSINKALVPIFSRAATSDATFKKTRELIKYYFFVATIMGVLVVLLSKPVLIIFFPAEYQEALTILPWLVLGIMFVGYYFIPMNLLAMTAGKTKFIPKMTFLAAAVNVSLNIILIPRFGMLAAAINTAVGYGILFCLLLLASARLFPGYYEWRKLLILIISSAAIAAIGFFVMGIDPWKNIIYAFLSLIVLLVVLVIFGFIDIVELKLLYHSWSGTSQGR